MRLSRDLGANVLGQNQVIRIRILRHEMYCYYQTLFVFGYHNKIKITTAPQEFINYVFIQMHILLIKNIYILVCGYVLKFINEALRLILICCLAFRFLYSLAHYPHSK